MKKTIINISIFLCLALFCACGFGLDNYGKSNVVAADNKVECCTMIARDAVSGETGTYQSTLAVGNMSGTGFYMVGDAIDLLAVAKTNYQIVGFEITYLDQEQKTETVLLNKDISMSHVLTYGDSSTANLLIKKEKGAPLNSLDRVTEVSLNLGQVGENLKITPIFDHIYSRVVVDNTQGVLSQSENINIGDITLYYSDFDEKDGFTTYHNAYVETGYVRYYYGNVYSEGNVLYTQHTRQDGNSTAERIPLSMGAFKQNETSSLTLEVGDFYDVVGILTKREADFENQTAIINKKEDGNTSSIQLKDLSMQFNTEKHQDLFIDIQVHRLHKVKMKFMVDNEELQPKHFMDFFGEVKLGNSFVTANVSTNNYFSSFEDVAVGEVNYPTQYFIKSYSANDGKAFNVKAVENISKTIDGLEYKYYKFSHIELNGESQGEFVSSISINEPSNNEIDIVVHYASIKYDINFEYRENLNGSLVAMEGPGIETITKSRGETIILGTGELSLNVAEGVRITGYEYVGLSLSATDNKSVYDDLEVVVSESKPTDMIVYVVFEKINYTIVLTGLNSIELRNVNAIDSIKFNIDNNVEEWTNNGDVSYQLASSIKLSQTLSIIPKINIGFSVMFSLQDDGSNPITEFTLGENQIALAENEIIYIYALESFNSYTLTYITESKTDENISKQVIMAIISAEVEDVESENVEIGAVTEILDKENRVVANQITVSGLYYGDKIKLMSAGAQQTGGEEPYYYIFNKFYKNQVTNTLTNGESYYSYSQENENETIFVVYGLPDVALEISWNDVLEEGEFEYIVYNSAGDLLESDAGNNNKYSAEVGETIRITVFNIKFGYSLTKYNFNYAEEDTIIESLPLEIVIGSNYNTLKLIFTLDIYRVYFKQWGEGFVGENYEFKDASFQTMSVADRAAYIVLPTGMFANKVSVNAKELEEIFEGYTFKQTNLTKDTFLDFVLTAEQFEQLIENYKQKDNNGYFLVIDLTYARHEYTLTFNLIVSGGSEEFNSTIASPELTLMDELGNPILSSNQPGEHMQVFEKIKYGTNVFLQIADNLKQGLTFNKWLITGNATDLGARELVINEMTGDVLADYVVTYVPYTVKLYNYSGNGKPTVNGVAYTGNQTVKLFESLVMDPMEDSGIKIKAVRNLKIYSYKNEAAWLVDFANLFYRENGEIFPATKDYAPELLYFYEEKELTLSDEAGEIIFKDPEFIVDNYFISELVSGQQTLNCVCIDLEYEYIQYSISHKVTGLNNSWIAMFGESGIYSFNQNGEQLDQTRTYTKNDGLAYTFEISTHAFIGEIAYNLTEGLSLNNSTITIGGTGLKVDNNNGNYKIAFNVGEYLPKDASTTIEVVYKLKIAKKSVQVETQITEDSTGEFKSNITFYLANGEDAPQIVEKSLSASDSFYYLSNMAEMRAQFKKGLADSFEFGEVRIYLNGKKTPLTDAECEANGISIIRNSSSAIYNVQCKLGQDIRCVFVVRPKMNNFQSGQRFIKEFQCDSLGNGFAQPLTVGVGEEIDISDLFPVTLAYYYSGIKVDNPLNVGVYDVRISFEGTGWQAQIGEIGTAIVEITPKVISATFDTNINQKQKVYNGSADYYLSEEEINSIIFNFKSFSNGAAATLPYSTVANWANNAIKLNNSKITAFSTVGGEEGKTANANESVYYNLYVSGLTLVNAGNFTLTGNSFEVLNYIQIQRKAIQLINVNIQNKVFDNTTNAKVVQKGSKAIDIFGEIEGEQLLVNASLLRINFENANVGANKRVVVSNIRNALTENNCDANNYTIEDTMEIVSDAGIYPDKISGNVPGIGEVSILNIRGLDSNDDNLITLIPIDARLEITAIHPDSPEYRSVYRVFGKNIKGNNEFAIGYSLKLVHNEGEQDISKELYVQVPSIKNMTGAYYLTGESSGKINYETTSDGILIDLNTLSVDLDKLMFTQQRILLKVWQIVLIVILFILLILIIILIIIIIRKRKKKDYSVHEKI